MKTTKSDFLKYIENVNEKEKQIRVTLSLELKSVLNKLGKQKVSDFVESFPKDISNVQTLKDGTMDNMFVFNISMQSYKYIGLFCINNKITIADYLRTVFSNEWGSKQ